MGNSRNALLNSLSGVISQLITLVLAFIVPRLVLTRYGSDTNGFTNTITQIFTYMALLEAGIAQAAKNALYKPLKENDKESISKIMSIAKKYYNRITLVYFAVVIILAFVVPFFLKSDLPYLRMSLYILFQGLTNVVVFYFIQKWSTFLIASGKAFIVNFIYLLNKILCYTAYIVLALFRINIVFVQLSYFALSFVQLLLYFIYMKKRYGWIKYNTATNKEKLNDKNSYIVSEVAWTIFSSTDMIVLSFFVSTSLASVYSIYNMVFLALSNLLNSVYVALNYRLGILFHKNIEEYEKKHDLYIGLFVGAMCALMSVSYLLIIPFVKLYTNGVNDIEYVYSELPILFCLIQIISWSRYIPGNLVGLSGRQKKAIKINIVEAALNILLSIILVNVMGIVGVLIATVAVLPIKVVYCIVVSDVFVLKRNVWSTFKLLLPNYLGFSIALIVDIYVSFTINDYLAFCLYGAVLFLIFSFLFTIINFAFNKELRLKIWSLCKKRC